MGPVAVLATGMAGLGGRRDAGSADGCVGAVVTMCGKERRHGG
jgi:hypothetical protein